MLFILVIPFHLKLVVEMMKLMESDEDIVYQQQQKKKRPGNVG